MTSNIPPWVLDKISNGSIVPEVYFSNGLPGGTLTRGAPPGILTNLIVTARQSDQTKEYKLLVIKRIIDTQPREVTRRSKRNDVICAGTKATPGFLPIHYAAERGQLDVIKLLLNARNKANKEGYCFDIDDDGSNHEDPANSCTMTKTPFYIAVQCNKIAVVRFLGKSGADVNFESKDIKNGGRVVGSALFCSATRCQGFPGIKMAKMLCDEFGVNVNACGCFKLSNNKGEHSGQLPVLVAAVRKLVRSDLLPISFYKRAEMSMENTAMMDLLLDKGADVNMRGENGETALSELTTMLTHDTGEAGVDKMFLVCMFVQGYGANLKYKYAFGDKPSLTLVEMVNLMLASSTNVKSTKAMHQMKAVLKSFKACAHGRNGCTKKAKNQCQRCQTVRYCCVEHQREDWNRVHDIPDPKWYKDAAFGGATWQSSVMGHKDTCKNIKKKLHKMNKVKDTGGCAIVKIQLVGLISKPELNGLVGTRSTFNTETKRYVCVFDDPNIPCVNVKEKNFVELDDTRVILNDFCNGPPPSSASPSTKAQKAYMGQDENLEKKEEKQEAIRVQLPSEAVQINAVADDAKAKEEANAVKAAKAAAYAKTTKEKKRADAEKKKEMEVKAAVQRERAMSMYLGAKVFVNLEGTTTKKARAIVRDVNLDANLICAERTDGSGCEWYFVDEVSRIPVELQAEEENAKAVAMSTTNATSTASTTSSSPPTDMEPTTNICCVIS